MNEKIDKKELITNLKRTWKYTKSQKKLMIKYFSFQFLISAIGAVVPVFAAKQILHLTNGLFEQLILTSLIIFGIEIMRNFSRLMIRKFGNMFFRETLIVIQKELASKTLSLEIKEIDNNSSGVFIDRINKDTKDIADIFSLLNIQVTEVVSNVGILIAVYIINKYFFIFFIIASTFIFLFEKARMKKYFILDKSFRKINEKNTGLITELIRGMRDIKILNANKTFLNKIDQKFTLSNQERYKMNTVYRNFGFIVGCFKDLADLSFIILCVYLIKIGNLTIPSAVILYNYAPRIFSLLSFTAQMLETVKNYNLSANRVFEIMYSDKFKKETFGNLHLNKINGDFEFKNVSFSYKEEIPVIKNVSFKIKANETVAFVGKSGSGKSTIFSLISKMYNINEGQITIDGHDINDLDEHSIKQYLYNYTVSIYL